MPPLRPAFYRSRAGEGRPRFQIRAQPAFIGSGGGEMRAKSERREAGTSIPIRAPRLFCLGRGLKPHAQRLASHLQSHHHAQGHLGQGSAANLNTTLSKNKETSHVTTHWFANYFELDGCCKLVVNTT